MEANRTMTENNEVTISGEIVKNFEFSHETFSEGFCSAEIAVERTSGQKDFIPIMVSERLVDVKADWTGRHVKVTGQFRSHNRTEGEGRKLILYVFATEFLEMEDALNPKQYEENMVFLDGFVCKPTIYRDTPNGREICEILLAVNRKYRKSDYIPCIAWGRNARFSRDIEIGKRIRIWGRIQSREYKKKISEEECETRTAYEVSISRMEDVEEDEQGED